MTTDVLHVGYKSSQFRLEVPASAARTSPLTWAQRKTWRDIVNLLPDWLPFMTLALRLVPPQPRSLPQLMEALSTLVARHEALRTHYTAGPDGVLQSVGAPGFIDVTVLTAGELSPEDAAARHEAAEEKAQREPFRHDAEFPARAVVTTRNEVVEHLSLVVSHVSADVSGMTVLREHLSSLLASSPEEPPVAWQPVDLALWEGSAEGRAVNERSLAAMRLVFETMAPSMFGERRPPAKPRFCHGEMQSDAAPAVVAALAKRFGASESSVLMAAAGQTIAEITGVRKCFFNVLTSNRAVKEIRWSVCTVAQSFPALFTVDEDLAVTARNAMKATLRAYRFSRFDPEAAAALVETVGQERGEMLDVVCRFNDLRAPQGDTAIWQAGRTRPATISFRALPGTDADEISFFIDVFSVGAALGIGVRADSSVLDGAGIEAFCARMHDVLMRANADMPEG